MRVLITNTVLLNGGDAAILGGVISQLKRAFGEDTEFVIGETQASVASKYYPELHLIPSLRVVAEGERSAGKRSVWAKLRRRLRWYASLPRLFVSAHLLARGFGRVGSFLLRHAEAEVMHEYHSADLVVATGGTYLVEHYRLGPVLFDLNVARLLGKPIVFFTQSLGPFRKKLNRIRLRKLFEHASLILLRDEPSKEAVESLIGVNSKSLVVPDAAFALAPADHIHQRPDAPTENGEPLKVAISVRFWPNFSRRDPEEGQEVYRSAIAEAVTHLVRSHRATVTFLSTCQGVSEYPFNDAVEARRIVDRLPDSLQHHVIVESVHHRPEEILSRLQTFHFVIATRMHMAILALMATKPVISIAYEFKTVELFKGSGLETWVTDIEEIEPKGFCDLIDDLILKLDSAEVLVRETVEKRRAGLQAGVNALKAIGMSTDGPKSVD